MAVEIFLFSNTRPENLSGILAEIGKLSTTELHDLQITVLASTRVVFEGGLPRLSPRHSRKEQRFLVRSFMLGGMTNLKILRRRSYLAKCEAMANSRAEIVVKMDDDIFLSASNLSRFLGAIREVNFVEVDVVAPVLTTGVPSVELFLQDWAPTDLANRIRGLFQETDIPTTLWGADYSSLEGAYKPKSYTEFFEKLARVKSHYKGVHPIRLSEQAQTDIVEYSLSAKVWELQPKFNDLVSFSVSPYFCNNLFACRTAFYRSAVEGLKSGVFFNDGFDEVAVNQALDSRGRRIQFARGVLGVHPSYNTVPNSAKITERFFSAVASID